MALTRYKVIADMAAAISLSTEYEDLLATVAEQTAQAFDVSECCIYEYEHGGAGATPRALWTISPDREEDAAYLGTQVMLADEPVLQRVLGAGEIVETRIDDPSLVTRDRQFMEEWGEKSCLWVPLLFGDHAIGCLELVETRYVRPFTDYDLEFAATVAALAAMAINNARARRREADHERKLAALLAASRDLALADDEREVLDALARTTGRALEADGCYIYLYDRDAQTITWVATWEAEGVAGPMPDEVGTAYPLDDFAADRRALTERVAVQRLQSDPALPERERRELQDWSWASVVSVPAILDGEPIGLLEIVERQRERRFDADEVELALALGEQAAAVLKRRAHRARLDIESEL